MQSRQGMGEIYYVLAALRLIVDMRILQLNKIGIKILIKFVSSF